MGPKSVPRRTASYLGHRAREALCVARMATMSSGRRVAISADGPRGGMASGLRGWDLADGLRQLGYAPLVLPAQLELVQRRRLVNRFEPDVLIVRKARHGLHRAELFDDGPPLILDLDDADFLDPKLTVHLERLAARAAMCIAGSRYVAEWLRRHNSNCRVIWTGSPHLSGDSALPRAGDSTAAPPVVGWCVSSPLGYHDEFRMISGIMERVRQQTPVVFRVQGRGEPDRIEAFAREAGYAGPLEVVGFKSSYDEFVRSLTSLSIGLAPLCTQGDAFSRGKSFGKVLGYLGAGVPIVASDAADHGLFFEHGTNGMLASTDDEWIDAIVTLARDRELTDTIRRSAHADGVRRLSQQRFCELYARAIDSVIDRSDAETAMLPASRKR